MTGRPEREATLLQLHEILAPVHGLFALHKNFEILPFSST